MISSKISNNGLENSETGLSNYQKQPPMAIKKIALRDVQNHNWNFIRNHPESSFVLEGGLTAEAIKVSETGRFIPECLSSPPCHSSFRNNGSNKHCKYGHRKFESELGKRRFRDSPSKNSDCLASRQICDKRADIARAAQSGENIVCSVLASAPIPMASLMTYSSGGPWVPISSGKPDTGLTGADSNQLIKVTSEASSLVDSKGMSDQQRKGRVIHLQKLPKHCDESNHSSYIQKLLCLSPSELSRHAVELEKRSIQLTVEEVKEIQRMKALNVLGNSTPTNDLSSRQIQF